MKLLYACIENVDAGTLLAMSDTETRSRALASARREKGLEIALGRYLARCLAAELLGTVPGEVTLRHDSDGRPFLAGSSLSVSISHSDGLAVAMVHPERIACDIQAIRRFPGPAVRGLFSANEFAEITSSPEPDPVMTRLFCRRECVIKWIGRRPDQPRWDAETVRKQVAPEVVFRESWLEGKCLCVLGPPEALLTVRLSLTGGQILEHEGFGHQRKPEG